MNISRCAVLLFNRTCLRENTVDLSVRSTYWFFKFPGVMMDLQTQVSRETWSADGKYMVVSLAKHFPNVDHRRFDIVKASVQVFKGDPGLTTKIPIFIGNIDVYSNDMDDQLDEAERLGLSFIASIC
jgi:hypothetical protein